jgi:hypothetical protein
LPEEYEKCLVGLNAITKEAWNTAANTEDEGKNTSIVISQRVLFYKLDLLTNATVVDDAIRFVSLKSTERIKSSIGSKEGEKEQLKEPDYDEDQLEKQQEEKTREMTSTTTTNQVF